MKLRNLLWGGLVCCALAIFSSCEPEQKDLGNPALTVSVSELAFEEVGGDKAITLNATRDWRVTSNVDWVVVAPASGEASAEDQTVVVSALANTGGNRTATLSFTIGTITKAVSVTQVGSGVTPDTGGDGTAASPYTAAKVTEVANSMSDTETKENVYVAGTVSRIKTAYDATYGNISYYIKNEGSDVEFLVYRGKYFNGDKFTSADQLNVGDVVVVCGTLKNYMGNTPELDAGNKIISINGKTSANGDDQGTTTPTEKPAIPETVTSLTDFLAAQVGDTWYKLEGQIINIGNQEYGNLTIKDEAGIELYVYGLTKDFASSNDKSFSTITGLSTGDIVTLVGQRGEYNGVGQAVNAFYISHEEGELDLGELVNFTKVTSALTDWTGTYLIYMGDNKAHATISSKDLAATSDVLTDNNGVIAAPEAFAVTIAAEGDKWSIKLPDGKYLGAAHNSCASLATPVGLNIEWTADGVKISGEATNSGTVNTYYLYYSTNNGTFIRFYVDKTGTNTASKYTFPTLYKK